MTDNEVDVAIEAFRRFRELGIRQGRLEGLSEAADLLDRAAERALAKGEDPGVCRAVRSAATALRRRAVEAGEEAIRWAVENAPEMVEDVPSREVN